ncbi:MAG: LysR family transcriptional regulator [Frisingicoccus sp.]
MDLKQLSYFAAIVDEGSISAAAKKLHISQPPLSNPNEVSGSGAGGRAF